MSETEAWTGKLIPLTMSSELVTFKDQVDYLQRVGFHFMALDVDEEYFDTEESGIIILEGKWYKLEMTALYDDYLAEGEKHPDGSITFTARFYNGGCRLEEVLEEIVEKVQ